MVVTICLEVTIDIQLYLHDVTQLHYRTVPMPSQTSM